MSQYEIKAFPEEVISKMNYYVYRLIDPRNGETFYVGKGKGNRVFQHMKGALDKGENDETNAKLQTIRQIMAAGLDVVHVIHRHGMDEDTSIEVEAALIDAYPSATNIVGGTGSNDCGPMNALEVVNKYVAEEAVFDHKLLMITVNKSLADNNMYDATRYAWRLDKNKAEQADYVLSVRRGVIVGIYKANEWKEANPENFPGFPAIVGTYKANELKEAKLADSTGSSAIEKEKPRYGFVGEEAGDSVKKMYIGKRIPESYRKKGASNPIRYSY